MQFFFHVVYYKPTYYFLSSRITSTKVSFLIIAYSKKSFGNVPNVKEPIRILPDLVKIMAQTSTTYKVESTGSRTSKRSEIDKD